MLHLCRQCFFHFSQYFLFFILQLVTPRATHCGYLPLICPALICSSGMGPFFQKLNPLQANLAISAKAITFRQDLRVLATADWCRREHPPHTGPFGVFPLTGPEGDSQWTSRSETTERELCKLLGCFLQVGCRKLACRGERRTLTRQENEG